MSLTTTSVGTAANILSMITPAKDIADIIGVITDSVEDVKRNEESTAYWDKVLTNYANEIFGLIIWCKEEGATDPQIRSLMRLLESLILLRKELIEIDQRSYLKRWRSSGEIRRKIDTVKRKMKQCRDIFVACTMSTHTTMLLGVDRRIDEMIGRRDSNSILERKMVMWKLPEQRADLENASVIDYAYLINKTQALVHSLNSNSGSIEELLLKNHQQLKCVSYSPYHAPVGAPQSECEDASQEAVRLLRMLQDQSMKSNSSITGWLEDLRHFSISLRNIGLKKERLQINEHICRFWNVLASFARSASILSNLALSLYNLAVSYCGEGRAAEALPLMEKAIGIYRYLGEPSLPHLARSLRRQSYCLRSLFRYNDALAPVQESVDIFRSLVSSDLNLCGIELVNSLMVEAEVQYDLSHYEDTLRVSLEACQWLLKLSPQYRYVYPYEAACASRNMALAYCGLEDLERAKNHGQMALKAYYSLIQDRPLYYSYTLSNALFFSSRLDHRHALSLLNDSLAVCVTVDMTLKAPQIFADILDRRAYALMSHGQYGKAIESYEQIIEICRRLVDDEESGSTEHFSLLLKSFRHRSSCLMSLQRQRDALVSLDAAQDAIVSRLGREIEDYVLDSIINELEHQQKNLKKMNNVNCTPLIKSLEDYGKVLSATHRIQCAAKNGTIKRQDIGLLLVLDHRIQLILQRFDSALLYIRDASHYYRSQACHMRDSSAPDILMRSLELQIGICAAFNRCMKALEVFDEAMRHMRVSAKNLASDRLPDWFWRLVIFFDTSLGSIVAECGHERLLCSLEIAIEILGSLNSRIIHGGRIQFALGRLLNIRAFSFYFIDRYREAVASAQESVEIFRRLLFQDDDLDSSQHGAISDLCHEWSYSISLCWYAQTLLAIGDTTAALAHVEEAVDIQKRIQDIDQRVYCNLKASLSLREDICLELRRTDQTAPCILEHSRAL